MGKVCINRFETARTSRIFSCHDRLAKSTLAIVSTAPAFFCSDRTVFFVPAVWLTSQRPSRVLGRMLCGSARAPWQSEDKPFVLVFLLPVLETVLCNFFDRGMLHVFSRFNAGPGPCRGWTVVGEWWLTVNNQTDCWQTYNFQQIEDQKLKRTPSRSSQARKDGRKCNWHRGPQKKRVQSSEFAPPNNFQTGHSDNFESPCFDIRLAEVLQPWRKNSSYLVMDAPNFFYKCFDGVRPIVLELCLRELVGLPPDPCLRTHSQWADRAGQLSQISCLCHMSPVQSQHICLGIPFQKSLSFLFLNRVFPGLHFGHRRLNLHRQNLAKAWLCSL